MKKFLFLLVASAITLFALDINTATKADFVKVKGIGAKKAERIIAYREEHGKFASVSELAKVKGIGQKIVDEIKAEAEEK
jgi:competence protein ComEA